MTDRGYLGEVLEELRLERGMSLSRLAEVAGVSKGYLSALESGKQKNPSLEALRGLASALGVSITVSRDEPGYIRVSEGSPPCVSFVRSGVPTVREEIEEAKEEAADWRTSDSGMWKPCLTKKRIEMLTPSRSTIFGLLNEAKIYKPVTITNEPCPVPNDAIVASGEGLRVSEVGKWPADYKAPSGGMAEGAVVIGVDLAHGPGKAVTMVWRVRDGKMERVEEPLAKAVELLDDIRGQVGEGDDAESFKMRLAQRVAQELVALLRWRADRVDKGTESGRRARLHNDAMVSMLAFNDDFNAWREDVMVASGKRRDPNAGKKRSE